MEPSCSVWLVKCRAADYEPSAREGDDSCVRESASLEQIPERIPTADEHALDVAVVILLHREELTWSRSLVVVPNEAGIHERAPVDGSADPPAATENRTCQTSDRFGKPH